ncbi:uncharacterized protein LOC112348565 [Selaginella moellendorffii]|uniref:uncharacterized protein LOC112348565 n=1 Tax=Selaginella moellendorffii TaxID=88036 RepID=UPI000D1C3379|nr:uncharacterized protein LOC112348565 [Selaginella moellendorffii]|eukprot:XP_024537124.1 uncharacterized protein LOC112348565 [Selaginella moellendorffii]
MSLAQLPPARLFSPPPSAQQRENRCGVHRNLHRRGCAPAKFVAAAAQDHNAEPDEWDVSRSCVNPVFRGPIFQEPSKGERLYVVFASEGNVCRSILAEAIFNKLAQESGLSDLVECKSKATKEYNVGESPEPQAIQVAEERGLKLPDGAVSKMFENPTDIVEADLIIVMDKGCGRILDSAVQCVGLAEANSFARGC